MARLQLLLMDALAASDPNALVERSRAVVAEASAQIDDPTTGPSRSASIARALESLQRHLATITAAQPSDETTLGRVGDELETVAEAGFRKALEATGSADLTVAQEFAEHLLFRDDRTRCLTLVESALNQKSANLPRWADTTTRLREVAIKAALMDVDDPERTTKAEPHIKALIGSSDKTHRAVGHLFQGVIDLERSGLSEAARSADVEVSRDGPDAATRAKLRGSALEHLKIAATDLPQVATAQALYGVALTLTGESSLGRQYLSAAQQLPQLEPRYQVWSAWALIQAGYPEQAEPIVAELKTASAAGALPADLAPTLHLLTAEIHQARRTPADLEKARDAYEAALAAGQPDTPALQLRMAQIDVMRGKPQEGLDRIKKLRGQKAGGPSAEHLAVLILSDAGQTEQARKHLDAARAAYPDSGELAGLDAALWLDQNQPEKADRVLADYLQKHPDDSAVVSMRARLLAETLDRPDEARALLSEVAEHADTSTPMVQLALLDLARGDYPAVAATIATIRDRWKEAAAADLLDAQLALAQNEAESAGKYLDAALAKDPSNKLALFWKAQLDDRVGNSDKAAQIYESIVKANPVKEIDDGLSLSTAAQWALANHALENRQVDAAITRLEDLLRGGISGELTRPVRWQLAAARAAKGEWTVAKSEIETLLADPKTTAEDRIRAANLFRLYGDPQRAAVLLDEVLKADPANSAAVAIRAYLDSEKAPGQAVATIREAINAGEQPASIYLMLACWRT